MLAAGIVLSTVCYAVLEAAVFNAIPYESPTHLVQIMKKSPEMGDAYWTRAFSPDVDAVGRSLTVDGNSYAVIGVAPPQLKRPVSVADVWIADETPAEDPSTSTAGDKLIADRLRPGCSLRDAEREWSQIEPAPNTGFSRSRAERFFALSLVDQIVGPAARILNLLLAACLLIQLLACLNVGHLLLARRMSKCGILACKWRLDAARGGFAGTVLVEAMTVAVGIALPLVMLSLPAAGAVTTAAIRSETHPVLSIPVLAFSIGAGLASSVVCAVVVALMLVRIEITALIRESWRFSDLTLRASRLQDVLVVVELAAAVVIMAGFGLLAKALYQLSSVSLGFRPEGLSCAVFSGGPMAFPMSAHSLEQVIDRLARLPGVESVAITSTPILTGASMKSRFDVLSDGGEWMPMPPVPVQAVSGGYFRTMGIAVEGRSFDKRDVRGGPCVTVVNRSFAKLAWGSTDALGKRIDIGDPGRRVPCEVIGVAADARDVSITVPPEPAVFFSHLQRRGSAFATVLIRAASGSERGENPC